MFYLLSFLLWEQRERGEGDGERERERGGEKVMERETERERENRHQATKPPGTFAPYKKSQDTDHATGR